MPRIVKIDDYVKLREEKPFNPLGAGDIGIPNFIELTKYNIINRSEMEVEPILINITNIVTITRDERKSATFNWKGGSTLVLNGARAITTLNVTEPYAQIISLIDKASHIKFY